MIMYERTSDYCKELLKTDAVAYSDECTFDGGDLMLACASVVVVMLMLAAAISIIKGDK